MMYHCLDEDCCHASVSSPPPPAPSAPRPNLVQRWLTQLRLWLWPGPDQEA